MAWWKSKQAVPQIRYRVSVGAVRVIHDGRGGLIVSTLQVEIHGLHDPMLTASECTSVVPTLAGDGWAWDQGIPTWEVDE